MTTTYETNVNVNNNVYEDSSSEIGFSSSTSSFADETKRNSILDNETIISSKRNKRHSIMNKFKKDKEKDEKEKLRSESGLGRPLSGIFSKDKDNNKRNNTSSITESTKPTLRTSSINSINSKNRRSYVFFSDDDEKLETDTNSKIGIKSRQISNAEGLEKDKLSKKEKRFSVLGKFMGFNENKSQKSKNDVWENGFIEPIEPNESNTKSSKILRNPFRSNLKNKQNNINNIEPSQAIQNGNSITGTITDEPKSITDDNPVDDIQSTTSSSQQSSSDDRYFNNKHENESTATTPITPVTPKIVDSESASIEFRIEELQDEKVGENNYNVKSDFGIQKNGAFTNNIDQQGYKTNTRMLQELATLNKSLSDLSNAKDQLEAKVAEQNNQITRFNSMEQIMQEQVDFSKRVSEMMQRLESRVNVPKEGSDGLSFEDTIRRLENKIDRQNDELIRLKSIVGQLTGGNQQLLLTNEDTSHISQQGEERALIQTNRSQSTQIYSRRTLVSTLVVSPLCNTITISASIATSVLYAVYVRPVVGLVSVLRDISSTRLETTD